MTITEAIRQLDSLLHNTYTQQEKLQWLSQLDAMVRDVLAAYEETPPAFADYAQTTDPQTQLLIPAPYDEAYLRWLEAQIHYHNGEYQKYNNAITLFNNAFVGFQNHYRRTHMPKGSRLRYF